MWNVPSYANHSLHRGDGIKNINGGPLSRELLFIRTPKTRILFLPMCTYVLARPSRGGIGGANVRRYSRFSFARLPIHLVASYHDRPSIQVHRCVSTYNGCIERSSFVDI